MKKILLLLLFAPLLATSQSEKDEKKNIVQQRSSSSTSIPSSTENLQKRNELFNNNRYTQPQNYIYPRTPIFSPFYRNDWYYGSPWTRYYWYDDWGFRNYSRIYTLPQGRIDTVKMRPLHGSFGVQTSGKEWGAFLTLGRKVYFLVEFQSTIQRDRSTFYSQITVDQTQNWNDKRLEDLNRNQVIYLGLGKRIQKTGFHLSLGIAKERQRYQYEDELKILSANGRYSIPSFQDNFVSLKMGASRNLGPTFVKIDYDVTRKTFIGGIGIKF